MSLINSLYKLLSSKIDSVCLQWTIANANFLILFIFLFLDIPLKISLDIELCIYGIVSNISSS